MSTLEQLVKAQIRLEKRVHNLELVESGSGGALDAAGSAQLLVSAHLGLPLLRGYWPLTLENNDADTRKTFDLSPWNLDLWWDGSSSTYYTADPTLPIGYIDFGTSAHLYAATDAAQLKITGASAAEGGIASASRGLTVGLWIYPDALGSGNHSIFCKVDDYDPPTVGSWWIYHVSTSVYFRVWNSGGTAYTTPAGTLATGGWYHLVGRFDPSTSVDLFVNGTKVSNTTSIPASIRDTTNHLGIGANWSGELPADIKAAQAFVCAAALNDATITGLYDNHKAAFGL